MPRFSTHGALRRDHVQQDYLMVSLTGALAEELANNDSGLAIIYRALEALVEAHGLEDAAIVIEEPNLGRQVFRAGRKLLDEDDEALLAAPPGVYTEPPLSDEEIDRSMINSVCVLALRMDVLRYDAWHDPLTGLDDRRSFDRLLEVAVANSNRYSWAFALVIIDMDLLKRINDSQGHAAGDVALRDLAERMQHTLRYGDSAARIGGDEFAMILPNTDADAVAPLLERIRARPGLRAEAPEFSYGVALCPEEATTVQSLFELADNRLREHKLVRKAHR
jgi:diguanylate cyclase (GGDEF)-like protein